MLLYLLLYICTELLLDSLRQRDHSEKVQLKAAMLRTRLIFAVWEWRLNFHVLSVLAPENNRALQVGARKCPGSASWHQ